MLMCTPWTTDLGSKLAFAARAPVLWPDSGDRACHTQKLNNLRRAVMRPRVYRLGCSRCASLRCYSTARSQRIRRPTIGPRPPELAPGNSFAGFDEEVDASGKPRWLRDLEADAHVDKDIKRVLHGCDGDPDKVEAKIDEYLASDGYNPNNDIYPRLGRDEITRVVFRAYNPSNIWVWLSTVPNHWTGKTPVQFWLELYSEPTSKQVELVTQLVSAWFMTGKMGGYNATNLQVHEAAEADLSFMPYEQSLGADEVVAAYYHDLGEVQKRGNWLRFQADLGTGDEVGLDVLINTMRGFSRECLGIKQLCIGGANADWPTPDGDAAELDQLGEPPVQTEMDVGETWTGEDDDVQQYVEHIRDSNPALFRGMLERTQQLDSPQEQAEALRELALQVAEAEVGED